MEPGLRTSSRPAVRYAAPKGRTHDCIPTDQQNLKFIPAETGPPTHDSPLSLTRVPN